MNALKVIVVLDTMTPQQWVVTTLEKIDANQCIQLDRIILQSPEIPRGGKYIPRATYAYELARKLLHGYINRSKFGLLPCKPQPLSNKLQSLVIDNDENSETTTDVVLHLGDENVSVTNLPQAKHGTWSVKHAELPCRLEESVVGRRPVLWLHLWQTAHNETTAIRRIGSHSLPMQSYSITDVLSYGFGSLPDFIFSRMNWLAQGNDPSEYESCQVDAKLFSSDAYPANYQPPSMSGIDLCMRTLILLGLQTKQRIRDQLQTEQWQLAFRNHTGHAHAIALSDYRELKPPANTIWADPHLITNNGQTHVFFEELNVRENQGRIAWAELTPTGFAAKPITVLEEDFHLSYPFVFKHEDEFYMVPETAARRCISLYRATHFPDKWERVKSIMENIDAADSTLFQHEGRWWLLTNGISHKSVDERDLLLLFYADDFMSGDWQPHPMNPVVTGIDRARMAGPIYEKDGELFRPSQYGSTRYGFGVNVSKIHTLTTTDYKETLVGRLSPDTNHDVWIGCHTAIHGDEMTVIDRLRRVRRVRSSY